MLAMQETLYKTDTPEDLVTEFYEIAVVARSGKDSPGYIFIEKHGWWDETSQRPKHSLTTICPDEGLTLEQARDIYRARRENRARSGFIHSFSPDPHGHGKDAYLLIEL